VTITELEARARLCADKDEIRELVAILAHRIVENDAPGIADLFTLDGILDYSNTATFARPAKATQAQRSAGGSLVFVGRKAIGEFVPAICRLEVKAFFTNHVIRVRGDDAVGVCFFDNRVTQQGESVLGAGRMFDEYRRIAGRWQISYRRQELFYFTGLKEGWAEGPDRDRQPPPIVQRGWEDELIRSWGR
jgi:hypothetical protein